MDAKIFSRFRSAHLNYHLAKCTAEVYLHLCVNEWFLSIRLDFPVDKIYILLIDTETEKTRRSLFTLQTNNSADRCNLQGGDFKTDSPEVSFSITRFYLRTGRVSYKFVMENSGTVPNQTGWGNPIAPH